MEDWFHFFKIIHNFRKKEGSSSRFQETSKYLDIENDIFNCYYVWDYVWKPTHKVSVRLDKR